MSSPEGTASRDTYHTFHPGIYKILCLALRLVAKHGGGRIAALHGPIGQEEVEAKI